MKMWQGQRIFRNRGVFVALMVAVLGACFSWGWAEEVTIADGKIVLNVPLGWEESELNSEVVLGGWQTKDRHASAFIQPFAASRQASMDDLMRNTVKNFENQFEVERVEEFKTGQVKGPGEKKWPAIYAVLDADLDKGDKEFKMRFFLMIFDTGDGLYQFQGSTVFPVSRSLEMAILDLMRSIVAKP